MANRIYPKYKQKAISGGANVNLLGVNVKAYLVDAGGYTYSDAHEFLSDIPALARIAASNNLSSKEVTELAEFKSANARIDSATGTSVENVVLAIDTGTEATSPLVAFFDTGITGLPITPAGGAYNVIPPSGTWFVM